MLRQKERAYQRKLMNEIEEVSSDPKRFWDHLKKLGPKKHTSIPMEVYNDDMSMQCDKQIVIDKWKDDFASLYNVDDFEGFDSEFF